MNFIFQVKYNKFLLIRSRCFLSHAWRLVWFPFLVNREIEGIKYPIKFTFLFWNFQRSCSNAHIHLDPILSPLHCLLVPYSHVNKTNSPKVWWPETSTPSLILKTGSHVSQTDSDLPLYFWFCCFHLLSTRVQAYTSILGLFIIGDRILSPVLTG